jgi:hypothetical protein
VPAAMIKFRKDLSLPCNYLIINARAATWKQIHHVTARIHLEYQRTPSKIFRAPGCLVFGRRALAVLSMASFMTSASYNDSISKYRQALATDVSADRAHDGGDSTSLYQFRVQTRLL